MYFKSGLIHYVRERKMLSEVADHIVDRGKHNKNKLKVMLCILHDSFIYGCTYSEYEALHFDRRTAENKNSYITVFYLLEQFDKYNPVGYRSYFRDKRKFNEKFKSFCKKEWLDLATCSDDQLYKFLERASTVVAKFSDGCSGKQVEVLEVPEKNSVSQCVKYIRSKNFNMVESYIVNHPDIKKLNPTSLNTMRIVTVHSKKSFNILCACQRIGAVGSDVDNISCGGSSALIDVETGKIISPFCCNEYRKIGGVTQVGRNEIGLKIPYWAETVQLLKNAAQVVPECHIIGWDVAITPDGPVLIEGNESFDSSVMQYYYDESEPGMKSKFEKLIDLI